MYLGYQKGIIKFYVEEPLDPELYPVDRWVTTEDEYILVGDEYVLKTDNKAIEQAKEAKIIENDTARDIALNQGVTYKDVLFDSDTDQKVNLSAMYETMDEGDTVIWFGMDNQALECSKEDIFNIGGLIMQLHNFCWTKNAEIKTAINEAETIEEVEAITINYGD